MWGGKNRVYSAGGTAVFCVDEAWDDVRKLELLLIVASRFDAL